ncbi:MAG: metal-dependent hydrolase [Syntrophales bacterium]|nr:metal-dependent hydrolase [Syntrophales bacterium]
MPDSIRWLSHSFFKVETSRGKVIIIDPWITNNPLCPVKLDDIDKADLVLVTHDHFDHSSNVTEIATKTGATVVGCPETVGKLKTGQALPEGQVIFWGIGMNIGGTARVGDISITMTQALHSSETGVPAGYIIKLEDGTTIYHAGDTGIFSSMKLLGELYDIDIALLPIGGCFTMDPMQAAHAVKMIKPKKVIPMHYKTFPILEQDASRFVSMVKEASPEVEVIVLNPGQEYKHQFPM